MKKYMYLTTALIAGLLAGPPAYAAVVTWDGGGDGVNWSDGTNWTSTVDNVAPTNTDTAVFGDVSSGTQASIIDTSFAATSVNYLQINQSTTTATTKITLAKDQAFNAANTTASAFTYGSTISSAAMFELDLDGRVLSFSSTSANGLTYNLFGTYTFDTVGSAIIFTHRFGTGTSDKGVLNFGSGSNLAVANVTADGSIGAKNLTTTDRFSYDLNVNIGSGSQVNVNNNSTLTFLRHARGDSASSAGKGILVNNSGTIDIVTGSKVDVRHTQVNSANVATKVELNNLSGGTVVHGGTLAMTMPDRGTANISNAGTWKVGTAAVITGELVGQGSGDTGVVSFGNPAGGVMTGSGASALLDYNPLDTATYLNQTLTLNNAGTIAPGAGTGGSSTSSVGTYTMTDINVTNTVTGVLAVDLGGTTTGLFDKLVLSNGTLDLTAPGDTLQITFVNGYLPAGRSVWTVLEYGAVALGVNDVGFDEIEVVNGVGSVGNAAYYTIEYGATSAQLKFAMPGTMLQIR